jgi:tripartite-type tricarboxylate transporter receptor subunit TctC
MGSVSRRQFIRILAVGSAGVALAACGQQAAPAPQPTTPPAAAPQATQAPPAAQPTQAPAAAAAFKPSRPVTFICPWAAGGGTDAVSRMLGTLLEKDIGQPFNVVNRTGGGGATGHTAGATAAPDGYTITIVTVEIAMMHWMKLAEVKHDSFAPIAQVNFDPAGVQVAANAPWNSLKELLDDAKANPGKFKASGTGKGGIWDLARGGMLKTAGLPVDTIPWVPSEGAAPGLQELIAGGVAVVTASLPEGASLIEAGKVKPLAIMGDKRDPKFPNTPTLKEEGIDWVSGAWRGIGLPKGAPAEIVSFYEGAVKKAHESNEFKEFMANRGYGMIWRNAKEFGAFMAQQDASMGDIMKEVGII